MTIAKKQNWSFDQRVHALPYGGQTQFVGRSVVWTTADTTSVVSTVVPAVPDGQCALIDKVVITTQANRGSPGGAGAAGADDFIMMGLHDSDGTLQQRLPVYLSTVDPATPSSPFGNQLLDNQPIVWEPQMPIPVPSGWSMQVSQWDLGAGSTPGTPTQAGALSPTADTNKVQVFGIYVDNEAARGAGYNVDNTGAQASRNWIATGSFCEAVSPDTGDPQTSTSTTQFVPARTGHCVLITDILVRLAPRNAAGSAGLELRQGSGGNTIFKWFNSRTNQSLTRAIKCRIYAEPGVGLEVAAIGSPAEDTSSIILLGQYVPADQVPRDAFYSFVEPEFPSGGQTSPDSESSTSFTLRYPTGSPGGSHNTRVSPGHGSMHLLEGYEISVQKSSEIDTGIVLFSLSTGPNVGTGLITAGTQQPTITGIQQIRTAGQNLSWGVDKIALPCQGDNGVITFEVDRSSIAYASPGTDAGIEGWGCTVWGRTIPSTRGAVNLSQFRGVN